MRPRALGDVRPHGHSGSYSCHRRDDLKKNRNNTYDMFLVRKWSSALAGCTVLLAAGTRRTSTLPFRPTGRCSTRMLLRLLFLGKENGVSRGTVFI